MSEYIKIRTVMPEAMSGQRLDKALANLLPEYSRTRLQGWILDGYVLIDEQPMHQCNKIEGGERVDIQAEIEKHTSIVAENITLDIVFEDEHLIIINKPAGLVVHPGAGNPRHTLMNALLYHEQKLEQLPRAGIVHRLDKDTSGLLMVARTPHSYAFLTKQLKNHDVQREYIAVVNGVVTAGGTVNQPIDRHPIHRSRMTVVKEGRKAKTHYRIIKKYRHHTQLRINLETGRTHQIRVHMKWLRYPIIGDSTYGNKKQRMKGMAVNLANSMSAFQRPALHARAIQLVHPQNNNPMTWEAPMPDDMTKLIDVLEIDAEA